MNFKRQLIQTLCMAAVGLALSPVWAQSDYPNRPIKLVVPFPPGGTSDVMGRLMADELGKILKQPVVVENIGGAGGSRLAGARAMRTRPELAQHLLEAALLVLAIARVAEADVRVAHMRGELWTIARDGLVYVIRYPPPSTSNITTSIEHP